jgi:hypothetical protein
MGNSESIPLETTTTDVHLKDATKFFNERYNLVPSFPGFENKLLDLTTLKRKFNVEEEVPKYIDLRTNFPQIINMGQLPFNPIISVVYCLHYQLLRNNLPVFPPSVMFIYRNIIFYKQVKSIMSFETIFQAIRSNGLCSENEFPTNDNTLTSDIPGSVYERSSAFKFIDIYKIDQNLETIKILLSNKYPIIVGFSVYYDMNNIESYMWLPDEALDKKMGGLSGVLVGYIEERQMFIMATTFGQSYGSGGYVLIPYQYILDKNLTFELYTLDFIRERVDGFINQRKEMINLQMDRDTKKETTKKYREDNFGSLFQ